MNVSLSVLGISAAVAFTSSLLTSQPGPFCDGRSAVDTIVASLGGHGTDRQTVEVTRSVPGGSERQCGAYGIDTPLYQRCRSGYVRRVAIEPDGTQILLSEELLGAPAPAAVVAAAGS